MLPADLIPASFAAYPPEAKSVATRNISVLKRLPLGFVPLLLREVSVYDWKFPAERQEIDGQFRYLEALSPSAIDRAMAGFAALRLGMDLVRFDWVNDPAGFSERLTAHLWSSQQIAAFRTAAAEFINAFHLAIPKGPPPMRRLAIAVIGAGVEETSLPLFQKLRPHGTLFTRLKAESGWQILLENAQARAKQQPSPYSHWYVDGAAPPIQPGSGLTTISWESLAPLRTAIVERMRKLRQGGSGTEELRGALGRLRAEDVGLSGRNSDGVLDRFSLNILAEGSGAQFFSTTFVQWAAREALRRAQPLTLLARFTPRHTEKSMNEALAGTLKNPEFDPEGSLVDADMGAYYTWLNLKRLPGAPESTFIAWFERHNQAFAISRTTSPGTTSDTQIGMSRLLEIATS